MKIVISHVCTLLIGLGCLCWIFSLEEIVYASEKARVRDMTPEELKTFEPGFGCETHCEDAGVTCSATGPCCTQSAIIECEKQPAKERCGSSDCGFWPWDPCDTECVQDPDADCGWRQVFYCWPGQCGSYYLFGGEKEFRYNDGYCTDVFQCHTGSI